MVESTPLIDHLIIRGARPSQRLRYVLGVLQQWYKIDFQWIEDEGDGIRIFRGDVLLARWHAHPLTLDDGNSDVLVDWTKWSFEGCANAFELWVPCRVQDEEKDSSHPEGSAALPVDPLAMTFWALTCWDEQSGLATLDDHGRPSTEHLPWSNASCDVHWNEKRKPSRRQHHWPWLDMVWKGLLTDWGVAVNPGLTLQPTFDVDVAFKHLGRPWWKTLGLNLRDVLRGNWSLVKERLAVLSGKRTDPYDTFDLIKDIHKGEALWWFVLAADRQLPYDVGLNPRSQTLPALAESLSWHVGGSRVSWHPGYRAMTDPGVFHSEALRFARWNGVDAQGVRAHFLRSSPGKSWVLFEEHDIREDASHGWSRDVGFRSGTSKPFQGFSVLANRPLSVQIYPVAVMDSAMRVGLNWTPDQANSQLDAIMEVVSDVGGIWMSCWHNTSVSDAEEWVGWRATYLHMIETARRLGKL